MIYPPVEIAQFTPGKKKDDFYFTASRLVPYKKIDLIVESFSGMPDKQLIVIGDGPDFAKIKAKAGNKCDFLGYQSNAVLLDHMQRAKAFVFAAEEDFGIIPLEAQDCGTPVIAYGKGGALETVRGLTASNPTGVFFREQSIDSVISGVKDFEANQRQITSENCVKNANQFAPAHFRAQLKKFVDEKWEEFERRRNLLSS